MARKNRKNKNRPQRNVPRPDGGTPRYRPGDKVRVKAGTRDPDFPDFPLGGWAGTIRAIMGEGQARLCEVEWSDATLKGMHPVYQQRCERDGLDLETIWLDEEVLLPDTGEPVVMESPGDLTPQPLRPFDQEDRIRAILGATSDEPVPEAGVEQLRRYQEHLQKNLSFPFNAEMWIQTGPFAGRMQRITVYRLVGLEEEGAEDTGLVVEAGLADECINVPLCDVETSTDSPNRRLLQDYSYWFCTYGGGWGSAGTTESAEDESPAATTGGIFKAVLRYSVYGMGFGAALGALLATHGSWGVTALAIGAGLGALVGWIAGSRYGLLFGAVNRVRGGPAVGGVLGLLAGTILGGSLSVFLVGCLGTIPGGIAGTMVGKKLAHFKIKPWGEMVWSLVGACIGGLILALVRDSESAVPGALTGATVGGISTAVLFLFVVVCLGLMLSSRE